MFTHIGCPVELPTLNAETKTSGRTYYTPDGTAYPSITTILGSGEKPWLDNWKAMLGEKKAAKETKRCSDRGTAVHEMAEAFLNNEENPTYGHDPVNQKMFNQLKFKLKKINQIRMQEAGLYSEEIGVAGRVDCVGEYEGVLSVIDFKTSNNNKDVDMVQDYFLQATFYALAWYELTGEFIEDIVILMAVEKGMMPLVFRDKINKYIEPLLQRIDAFNGTNNG